MTQIPYFTPTIPQDFRNRKGGLVAFGIVMIVIGALCGCMAGFIPVAMMIQASSGTSAPSRMGITGMISIISVYAAIATGMIWTGIGSIQARRWVRPIVLVFGTIWLSIGVIAFAGVLMALTALPQIMSAQRGTATATPLPSSVATVAGIVAVVLTLIIYILIPGIAVWFYRSVNVMRTLEFYDPVWRWTDRCPLPVLGMSMGCALFAGGILLAMGYGVLYLFGMILTGVSLAGVLIPVAAVYAVAAVLIYRQKMLGWNLAVAMTVIGQGSMIVSTFLFDVQELGTALGATTQELDIMRASPMSSPIFMVIGGGIVTIATIIYAIRIRHYFGVPEPV